MSWSPIRLVGSCEAVFLRLVESALHTISDMTAKEVGLEEEIKCLPGSPPMSFFSDPTDFNGFKPRTLLSLANSLLEIVHIECKLPPAFYSRWGGADS